MPAQFYPLALLIAASIFGLMACASAPKPQAVAKPKAAPIVKAPARFTTPITTLNGQVLNAANQAPIAGVKILTIPGTIVITTDSSGHFSLQSTAFRADVEYTLTLSWRSAETTLQIPPVRLGEVRRLEPIFLDEGAPIPFIEDTSTPSSLEEGPQNPTLNDPDQPNASEKGN